MTIKETLNTKIVDECDVLVCGGGVAGVAAALAARRGNKKVILLEREYMLGGLATAGLIAIYLPLCDGYGKQVSFGISEELLKLSVKLHKNADLYVYKDWILNKDTSVHTDKTPRYQVQFNPALFAIECEKQLLQEGVKIIYGAYVVNATVEDKKITNVIIEGKSGRQAIKANVYIDATGDFDLGHYANCPSETFEQGNVLSAWYYSTSIQKNYAIKILGPADKPKNEKPTHEITYLSDRRFKGLETEEISEFTQMAHEQVYQDVKKYKENDETYEPALMFSIPQLRMTRRIKSKGTIDVTDEHIRRDDSIGMVSNWKKRGPVYEVPFSTLYNEEIVNLLSCGRCSGASEQMWDVMRVIPCCALTGEACGVAASMNNDVTKININALQAELRKRGIVIHEEDLK